jgi:hypothetical protein
VTAGREGLGSAICRLGQAFTFRGPGRRLIFAADEEVTADELPLRARLAVCARDAVDAVVPHRLLLARRIRTALFLLHQTADPWSELPLADACDPLSMHSCNCIQLLVLHLNAQELVMHAGLQRHEVKASARGRPCGSGQRARAGPSRRR